MAKTTTSSSRGGELPLRLQALHHYYQNFEHIWDIGCDHGLLGLSFIDEPLIQSIHLVDPSRDVMNVLQQKLNHSHIPKKNLFLHPIQGQKIELQSKNNLIFIAGMGGKEIRDILTAIGPQLRHSDLVVISPHRNILKLREFLHHSEFHLFDEKVVEENEQFYQIIALKKDPHFEKVSPFGAKIWDTSEGKRYRERELFYYESHRDGLSREYFSFLKAISP